MPAYPPFSKAAWRPERITWNNVDTFLRQLSELLVGNEAASHRQLPVELALN